MPFTKICQSLTDYKTGLRYGDVQVEKWYIFMTSNASF